MEEYYGGKDEQDNLSNLRSESQVKIEIEN